MELQVEGGDPAVEEAPTAADNGAGGWGSGGTAAAEATMGASPSPRDEGATVSSSAAATLAPADGSAEDRSGMHAAAEKAAAAEAKQRYKGVVKVFNVGRGFGFITYVADAPPAGTVADGQTAVAAAASVAAGAAAGLTDRQDVYVHRSGVVTHGYGELEERQCAPSPIRLNSLFLFCDAQLPLSATVSRCRRLISLPSCAFVLDE